MSERSLVSVVIPTYYRNERLAEAIESAHAQEWPVEVVVVDGSGEAHARSVAEEYGVEYVPQERDRGPHAARSEGAGHADGAYVQFLDDDDRLRPGKFAAQVPRLAEDGVGVVYSGLVDEEWGVVEPRLSVEGDVLEEALKLRTFPCIPSTMLVERDLVEALRPFEHCHGADDSEMKIELAKRTRFAAVDEPLVERGKPDDPLSRSWAHIEGRNYLLEQYEHLYRRYPDEVRRIAARQTDYREGRKRLEESAWDAVASVAIARAAYATPEETFQYAATTAASVFGRPGVNAAERVGVAP